MPQDFYSYNYVNSSVIRLVNVRRKKRVNIFINIRETIHNVEFGISTNNLMSRKMCTICIYLCSSE